MAGRRMAGDEDSGRIRGEEVKPSDFNRESEFSMASKAARNSSESFRLSTSLPGHQNWPDSLCDEDIANPRSALIASATTSVLVAKPS
jgi:hypothetical protein